jgi:ABC-2 type transport system ATP-binding protein
VTGSARGRAAPTGSRTAGPPLVRVAALGRSFGDRVALDGVDLVLEHGQVHALLGPNGAGKSTLLRILSGLVDPTEGAVEVLGRDRQVLSRGRHVGEVNLVPSGDRTFYLRISGLENLVFFGRLHGLRYRAARARALECLADVGLQDVARMAVSTYSHGMQKRLSVARAMLTRPRLLLVDEATHDLDPHAATVVQDLVRGVAAQGTGVLWATQRLDEIRGFADRVTVLDHGTVRFAGTVAQMQAESLTRRFVLQVAGGTPLETAREVLSGWAVVEGVEGDPRHVVLWLREDHVLGDAISRLAGAGVAVLACREERSGLEAAFLAITSPGPQPAPTAEVDA